MPQQPPPGQQGRPPQFGGPQQQWAPQQQPYRPQAAHRASPFAAISITSWCAIAMAAAGLLGWLLSLFADRVSYTEYALAGGLLALLVLIPERDGQPKVPRVLPFAAALSVLAGLLVIRAVIYTDFGLPMAIGVIMFVLVVLQMLAGIAAVLLDYGLVSMPPPRPPRPQQPTPPRYQPPQQGQPVWGGGQPPQQQYQPPQQQQPGPQQPAPQQQPPGQQPPQQPGNFDPGQFDKGGAGGLSQGTRQFAPGNYES